MNAVPGIIRKLLQQGRLILIALCLALLVHILTHTRTVQEDTSSNLSWEQDNVSAQVSTSNGNLTEDNKKHKLLKEEQQKQSISSKLEVLKRVSQKPTLNKSPVSKYIRNKIWYYGDYIANDTITAFYNGRKRHENIDTLLNTSYIREVSDQMVDIENGATITFLRNYRNPCWFESITTNKGLYDENQLIKTADAKIPFANTLNDGARVYSDRVKSGNGWRIRCIPYFYIIGFTKCGTTDLYMRLQDHPHVINGLKKEYHWWSAARFGSFWRTKKNKVPLRDYADMFDVGAESIRVNCVEQGSKGEEYHPCVAGEGSITTVFSNPTYEVGPDRHRNPPNTSHMVPAFMKHLIPNVKIIIMLRNPVDRLYSSYVYFSPKNSISNRQFDARVRHAEGLMTSCIQTRGQRNCAYDPDLLKACGIAVVEGMYSVFLKDWYEIFPREQIKLIKMEEYSAKKAEILQDTVHFLELEPYSPSLLQKITRKDVENSVKKYYASKGNILPSTADLLRKFYKPYVDDLVQLTGDERWRWF